MRILHLVHQYLPEHVGGTELYTHWLTRALRERGHAIAVFARRSAEGTGLEKREAKEGEVWFAWSGVVRPTRRFLATFREPWLAHAFARVLDEFQPEVVHIQHLMGHPVELAHMLHRRGLPYVITLWDFWWVCANANLRTNYDQTICDGPRAYFNCARCALARANWPGFWLALPPLAGLMAQRNRLLRGVLAGANALIAPTRFVHRWYADHRAPSERLMTIPAGLERPRQLPPDDSRAGRGDAPRPLRFVYIGGLAWQKGVHTLIEAFGGVRGNAELWIVGDESFDPAYVARLRAIAGPTVRFLGRLPREAVWETLAQVDAVTVPTLLYETFSFIVSEAFAVGVPVIASRLGPLVDRVRHEVDGLLVPPGDVSAWRRAMQRLVDESALLPTLRGNIQPVETMDSHAVAMEEVYQNAIQ